MARKVPTHEARAARDALLKRAQWIIDSNIRAACGYNPILPDDLVDFSGVDAGLPSPNALVGLLKSVMPAIDMKDDRRPHGVSGATAVEQAEDLLAKLMKGDISLNEADSTMILIKNNMEVRDRAQLTEFLVKYSEKNNIQLKSF